MPEKTPIKNLLKLFFKFCFFFIVAVNLFLGAWFVLHGDLIFSSDVARDFFLYQEITVKKIVLIGPHSSTGLFHGPLWSYLNYPAFKIGNGNPIVVGWYWIFLIIIFLIANFYIAKTLFNNKVAYLFTIFESGYLAFHAKQMNNPHGAMFLIPLFFFLFIKYWENGKIKFLLFHLLVGAMIVEFQMAIGIPFLILSFIAIFIKILKTKKYAHILAYLFLIIPLSNFIIFDLRHNFLLSKLAFSFMSPGEHGATFNYFSVIWDRIWLMFSSVEILRVDPGYRNLGLFIVFLILVFRQIKDNKFKTIYLFFLYFYSGFFALSFINKGYLLYFYLFPLFPFVHLAFVSLYTSRLRPFFLIIFFLVLSLNFMSLVKDDQTTGSFIGNDMTSWKFLSIVAESVYKGQEKEFGYFVFTPDTAGFGPKYAFLYAGQIYNKPASLYVKKPVTYLISEPHPYLKSDWWRVNKAYITNSPVSTFVYPNGYKIEKYLLSPADIKIPPASDIDLGIFFR